MCTWTFLQACNKDSHKNTSDVYLIYNKKYYMVSEVKDKTSKENKMKA